MDNTEEILERIQNIELLCIRKNALLESLISKRNSEDLCEKIDVIIKALT